ncbi:MAG TPA: hypothetical protein PK079_21630 [Leptospiraceae bacterium]|nr:hypothetical protein [Leptospiraceae bacterium]HMW08102.1 hypothetical protein [Leptospiraceae bacterium]HMY33813.1 hypothetical protein [Leptospiraceae bacterium]HMZ65924.1 hypothetical protein [Leptospiraceae bacterium]HNA08854.1 hypothetical protein [Leptospiraceae bacterium]
MKAIEQKLINQDQTVSEIQRIAKQYVSDLDNFKDWDFFKFYNLVRALPYVADPIGKETLSRPCYTILNDWTGSRDCDDKTILLVSKAIQNKIPYRIVICGQGNYAHHVYPEILFCGLWLPADATYPNRSVFGKYLYKEGFRKVFPEKK